MTEQKQPPSDPTPAPAAGNEDPKKPLQGETEPVDLMGLRPYDAQASIAAVRRYFSPAKD